MHVARSVPCGQVGFVESLDRYLLGLRAAVSVMRQACKH